MQSYAQILDPKLSHRQAPRASAIGSSLPPGWRYRVRRLRRDLAVGVKGGEATIVQDELQNTYQLAKTTRRPGPRKRHRVSVDGPHQERPG